MKGDGRKSSKEQGGLPVPRELLSAGIELDPVMEREREARLEQLKAALMKMVEAGDSAGVVDKALGLVLDLERENERLSWRLLRALRHRFGRNTEKLSREELAQLVLALGGDEESAASPAPEVPTPDVPLETSGDAGKENPSNDAKTDKNKKKRKRADRTTVSNSVERIVHPAQRVEGEERICPECGREKDTFGFVEHQRIEFVPAKVVVHVESREKCSCTRCRAEVSVAERATTEWTRRIGPSLLAKLVYDKCAYAMPLHRQGQELERLGLHLPAKTIDTCWAYALDLLGPVALATRADVLGSPIVGADDSHLKTLDKSAKKGAFRGRLWCFVGTDGQVSGEERVAYGYAPSWEAEEIRDWFSAIDGDIQCDGYAGYRAETEDGDGGPFVAVPDDRRLGCSMHVRSKFHAALLGKDKRAAVALQLFAELYAIEAECKERGLDTAGRGEARRARSIPILDAFDTWVDDVHPKLLPKSPLRVATTYAIGQRPFLRRCFTEGRFEIDNGRVERRIRLFAVGRRNFLFTGSVRGGERLADAYTLVDNCLRLNIDPQRYLEDILVKLEAGWLVSRLSELTPHRWLAAHQAR